MTATVCRLLGIECGGGSPEGAFPEVVDGARALGIGRCERALLYAPDAIGLHLCDAFPEVVRPVAEAAPIAVRTRSVVPPVTPVCFATMFTGEPPAVHGVRRYEKPVLRRRTLFDRLIDAGKRVAVVAVRDSSIDLMYRERALDLFSEEYDAEVTERTLRLLEADGHDFILAYHQEYDDALHRTTPLSREALDALRRHAESFVLLAGAAHRCWGSRPRMLGFVPDHGGHVDPATGRGTHGADVPEDMDVRHFFGVFHGGSGPGGADPSPTIPLPPEVR